MIFLVHTPLPTSLWVDSDTSLPGHLFISWSYTRPARTPIYRTVRGKMIFCGYKYIWDTPNIEEQQEFGDTTMHTFHLINLLTESRLWYYLHEPQPPSEFECQGPLMMVDLPAVGPTGHYLYFASRTKGMFRTTTFTGPGEPHPVWVPDNVGIEGQSIRQAVLDPFIPGHRRYLIAGGHLYRHFNDADYGPANSITILTWPEAAALMGSGSANILWVDPNIRHPGMLHVLCTSDSLGIGCYHLRTLDYGEHWTAHQIHNWVIKDHAGNIQAGHDQGTSPYPEGDVLYAAINTDPWMTPYLGRSFDQGATWTAVRGPDQARGEFLPRLYIDPSNQAVLYMGCHPSFPKLYRSENHGDSWSRVDRGINMTITLQPQPYHADLRVRRSNPNLLRLVRRFWTARSLNHAASWDQFEHQEQDITTHQFTDDNPNLLHLAKTRSGSPPPPHLRPHVIFVTNDEGITMHGKAGANAHLSDGGGDSIPYDCGGCADDGILIVSHP